MDEATAASKLDQARASVAGASDAVAATLGSGPGRGGCPPPFVAVQ